jgi:hypothetical protein
LIYFLFLSSPVFVEVIKSKGKNGKIYETHLVRESFRTLNGPRSRTVCNISKLPASIRDMISLALKGSSVKINRDYDATGRLSSYSILVGDRTIQSISMGYEGASSQVKSLTDTRGNSTEKLCYCQDTAYPVINKSNGF